MSARPELTRSKINCISRSIRAGRKSTPSVSAVSTSNTRAAAWTAAVCWSLRSSGEMLRFSSAFIPVTLDYSIRNAPKHGIIIGNTWLSVMQVPACMSSQYLPTYTRPLQKSWLSCMNMNANIRVVYNPVGRKYTSEKSEICETDRIF